MTQPTRRRASAALVDNASSHLGAVSGSGGVASYFDDMQHYFGVRGQVSLGNTGTPPYTSAQVVADDMRMLAAMRAQKIPIFDFDSSAKTFGPAGIAQILDAANHPMSAGELAAARQMSATGTGARAMFRVLEELGVTEPERLPLRLRKPDRPALIAQPLTLRAGIRAGLRVLP
jgi:hypothetical protein